MSNTLPRPGRGVATTAALLSLCLMEASCGKGGDFDTAVRSALRGPRVTHVRSHEIPDLQQAPEIAIGSLLSQAATLEPMPDTNTVDTYNPIPAPTSPQALVTVSSPGISSALKKTERIESDEFSAGILFVSYLGAVTENLVVFDTRTTQVVELEQVARLKSGIQPLYGNMAAQSIGFEINVEPVFTPIGYGVRLLIGGLAPGPASPN
jgi:hypothetical protein